MRSRLVAIVLLVAGCSGYWGRRPLDQPIPVKRSDPVWIWTRSGVEKWHAVVITQDSVSGIPFDIPAQCELDAHRALAVPSCRRAIPRTQVDSMKLGYRTFAQNVTEVVGVVALLTVADGVVCYVFDRGNGQC
jgi:hypothetical protein